MNYSDKDIIKHMMDGEYVRYVGATHSFDIGKLNDHGAFTARVRFGAEHFGQPISISRDEGSTQKSFALNAILLLFFALLAAGALGLASS